MKKVDKITLGILLLLFAGVTAANAIQPNRPTESAVEQRPLATIPTFSLDSLMDGSYFAGWSSFVSDTFLGREMLVDLSKEMDTLMGISYDLGGEDQFAILQAGSQSQNTPDVADEEKLAEAFDRLNQNKETESETEFDSERESETEPESESETEREPETETELETESESETEPESETETESEPESETEPVPDDETGQVVYQIILSKEKLRLTIGSGSVVYASAETSDGERASVSWTISDKSIATISANPGGGVKVKGVAEGQCILRCSSGDTVTAECIVTVAPITGVNQNTEDATADFITGGMFIYGDAVYTQAYYSDSSAKYYAQTAAYYQTLFGEDVQVSVVVAPVSSMVIDSSVLQGKVADQGDILDKLGNHMEGSVNFADVYTEMFTHKNEYLFYKSDHHWTQRGAYYAYRAFAESVGLTPVEMEALNYEIINESYSGSLYNLTKDSRVKDFRDLVETWTTKKELTMTVTSSAGYTSTYSSTLSSFSKGYTAFIMGDNPYTVINVPENPQDKNILVLKDSFGNAFVPFLCEHYGNIIVLDVRYTDMNIYEHLKDYELTDIVFVNNVQAALNTAWPNMYLNAVGVN